jgi:acyl-CoA hydrolase
MEIHIDVLQKIDGEERLSCSANFVMVARNKTTGKSYEVPRLVLNQEK